MLPVTDPWVIFFTYMAVGASAISGALEARKRRMDVVGAMTVAFVTAFGGGTLRDLLLGRTPIFWLHDPGLSLTAIILAILTYYFIRSTFPENLLLLPDAIGLGLFSVLGAAFALEMDLSWLVASLMGVVTGVFGGISRDVLCNQVPSVFRRNTELYATCAFVGAWVFIVLERVHFEPSFAALAGVLAAVLLRLAAVRYRMTLPDPN